MSTMNACLAIIGIVFRAVFTGIRNPENGKIMSRKNFSLGTQRGVITFKSDDDETFRASKIEEARTRYNVLVSPAGDYVELY